MHRPRHHGGGERAAGGEQEPPDGPRAVEPSGDGVADHRARRLALHGPRRTLTELHPAVGFDRRGRLTLAIAYDAPVSLDGRGLLLVPSVLTWPSIGAGAISQHAGALHAAGLLSRRRDGHAVVWTRTELADRLLSGRADG